MSTEREWGLESSDGDQETKDVASEVAAAYEVKLQAEIDSRQEERFFWIFALVLCVPIRLSPIPTTSRVLPIPRVKLGLGRAAISPAMSSAS